MVIILNYTEWLLLGAFGLAIAILTVAMLAYIFARLPVRRIRRRLDQLTTKEVTYQKPVESKLGSFGDPSFLLKGLAGTAFFVWIFWPTSFRFLSIPVGLFISLLVARYLENQKQKALHRKKVKELVVLYDAVDIFSDRYPVHTAMIMACSLTQTIKPAVLKCVNHWAQGPVKALHLFSKEVNVPEADILAAILQHVTLTGKNNISGIISDEARKLEDRLRSNYEKQMAVRPLYQTIYLAIPGFALMGILLFPLGYKAVQMIKSLHAGV